MSVKKIKKALRLPALNLIFIVLCFVTLLPILYALSVSLNASNSILTTELRLFPREMTLQNYQTVLFDKPFLIWIKNSALLSVFTVALTLAVAVPAAYAFSRFRFGGRRAAMNVLLLLNAFPAILSMFAIYRMMKLMNLLNSYLGLVLIYTGTMAIFALWNMKGYFDSIPKDIEEAARIDGVSDFQLVTRIVLPLARPSIIVTAVLVLIYVWNEYIFTTVFLSGADKYALAVGLYSLQATEYPRNWPLFSAASILTSIPVLIIFFMIQKHMVSGLAAGGVKG